MKYDPEIALRLQEIAQMGKPKLVELWTKHFGTAPPRAMRRDLMVRFVASKTQEQAYGGLDGETKSRLPELARKIEKDPNAALTGAPRIKPGTFLIRDWRGRSHRILVLENGYEYSGRKYSILSEIARLITGTGWSGPLFFGVKKQSPKEAPLERRRRRWNRAFVPGEQKCR